MTDHLTDQQQADIARALPRLSEYSEQSDDVRTVAEGVPVLLAEIRHLQTELARRVQCGDCGAVGDVNLGEDGRSYLYPSGQIGH